MVDLFRKTILNNEKYEKLIGEKTQNWEVERIALIDMILLKMSMAELISFPGIPVPDPAAVLPVERADLASNRNFDNNASCLCSNSL